MLDTSFSTVTWPMARLAGDYSADLMLRTTWYDGDAISVREALHFGVPVIASDNGMRPKGTHLIPARDLEALVAVAEKILIVLRHGSLSLPRVTGIWRKS